MINPLRTLLRVALASAIVLFCGAAACGLHPVEIAYAPGYGYVVHAERSKPNEKFYFVFSTRERAEEFYGQYYASGDWPADALRPGETGYEWNGNGAPNYEEIDRTKIPLSQYVPPPPLNDTATPLVTPDLPEPIPQTPQ